MKPTELVPLEGEMPKVDDRHLTKPYNTLFLAMTDKSLTRNNVVVGGGGSITRLRGVMSILESTSTGAQARTPHCMKWHFVRDPWKVCQKRKQLLRFGHRMFLIFAVRDSARSRRMGHYGSQQA